MSATVPKAPCYKRARGNKRAIFLIMVLLIPLMPFQFLPAIGDASYWGESIGDVMVQHSWGHGSSNNLTLTELVMDNGAFSLTKFNDTNLLKNQDLKNGNLTNITIKSDKILNLKVVEPSWSRRGGWDIKHVDTLLGSATPVLGDIDDDGDQDAYVGLENGLVAGYNNTGDETAPTWTIQDSWNLSAVTTFAVPALGDLDNDGDMDMMVGDDDGKTYGHRNTGDKTSPSWQNMNSWNTPDVGNGAAPALADLDNDGDLDLLIGNSLGQTRAYENTGSAASPTWSRKAGWDPPNNSGVANPSLGDLDTDGDLDLLIGLSDGTTVAYQNTGSNASPTWTAKSAWDINDVGDYASPALGDVDNDTDLDVFVGEWFADSMAYENLGKMALNGTYYSKAKDAGGLVNWTTISWNETKRANTDATIYVRTGNSTDPTDGTWSQWTAGLSTPGGSSITAPPGRYIQVKVYLETTNTLRTADVSDITMDFWYYNPQGALETNDLSVTDLVRWETITTVNNSKGQTTGMNYSVDSGSNWTPVPSNGNLSGVNISSGKIRFRANLSTSDPLTSPTFTGINVTYMKLLDAHHLHLTPTFVNVTVGDTFDFTAELHDINNNTLNGTLIWTTTIGAINASGGLRAQTTPGSGSVNVTYGPLSIGTQVNVRAGPLSRLNITPSSIDTDVGSTVSLSATGYDKYDNPLANLVFNWSSDVGSLNPTNGNATTFTAQTSPGSGVVNVTVGNMSTSIQVNVRRGPLVSIAITPKSISANESQSFSVNAKGYDRYDNEFPSTDFNWSTDVGSVDPSSGPSTNFTAQTVDDNLTNQTVIGNVSATYGSVSNSIDVTITGEFVQWLTDLAVEPEAVSLHPTETATFNISALDQFGNVMDVNASWMSDVGIMSPQTGNSSVLTPTVDKGLGVVTATVGDISASADVTVLPNDPLPFPRIVSKVPDQTRIEDAPPWTMDLNGYESGGLADDALLWHLEDLDSGLLSVSGEYDPSDKLTFVPVQDASGSDLVTFVLEDRDGNRDSVQAWINITPINDPPFLNPVPDLVIRFDDPYKFNYLPYVKDIDTPIDGITIQIPTIDPTNAELQVQIEDMNVTYLAPRSLLDMVFNVEILVNDGTTSAKDAFSLKVSDNYVPELIKSLPDVTLLEGQKKSGVFDLDDYFLDKDKDVIFFTYGNNNVDITINEDHTVDIEAASQWNGEELVTFRATDSKGSLVEDDVLITVLPFDDAPLIEGVPDILVRFGSPYYLDLTPYITDIDTPFNELTLSSSDENAWWVQDPNHVLSVPPPPNTPKMTVVFEFPQELQGSIAPYDVDVTITVSDLANSDSDTISVHVTDNWPPEITKALPDVRFDEDTMLTNAFKLSDHFKDQDGNPLEYSYHSNILSVRINEDLTVDISAPKDWNGIETITFRAKDDEGAIIEDTIEATVVPVNDPPVLAPISNLTTKEKTLYTLNLGDLITDIDHDFNELTIEFFILEPTLSGFVTGTDAILYPNKAGTFMVTVKVSDPDGASAERSFFLKVLKAKGNGPPSTGDNTLLSSLFWPVLILILLIAIASGGYMGYRKHFGNFIIDEAFVVLKDGRLVAHISRFPNRKKDETVFSGMVAAVQLFIEDTFEGRDGIDTSTIQKMEFKGNIIMVERAEHMFLAILMKGRSGSKIQKDMSKILKDLEEKYGAAIEEWEGDVSELSEMSYDLLEILPGGYSKTLQGSNG